ncbi:MAG: exodeoxyribonuclease VII small subunit [Pseudobacter sp.]|uniref:exodeoxyribonuclease VII small subunit n=1 Tax=Pseudobacter sp. TaxID=2045420 RepID=UPI003F807784
MESSSLDYTVAFEELQQIVNDIELGEISVDELSDKVKRAAELIRICRNRLTTTEEDVNKIIKELDAAGRDPFQES